MLQLPAKRHSRPQKVKILSVRPSQAVTVLLLVAAFSIAGGARWKPQTNDLRALDGEWIFLEDRTEGRSLDQLNPPMSSRFLFKAEEGAVVLVWGHGGSNRDVRVKLDGTPTEIPGAAAGALTRYRANWKDGKLTYEVEYLREGGQPGTHIKREFRMTTEGLVVQSNLELTPGVPSVGLYRKPQDIPLPTPVKATINDVAWIAGNWAGARGTNGAITFEERWSPPKGGSMFAISRTVNRDRLSAFEFLRIIERDGGLVYVAQPNGGTATEFILSELSENRAVFDNPRHDYPKRIVYERTAEGGLTATIGYIKGGSPRKFEFRREGS